MHKGVRFALFKANMDVDSKENVVEDRQAESVTNQDSLECSSTECVGQTAGNKASLVLFHAYFVKLYVM